jgi:ubiquinone biosynthesis protein
MQKLAFDILETTKDMPFKLPSDAIYILRVSAIVEGLGTTYIENFNGVKDILPILQQNIPKALGAKDTVVETVVDEVKQIPFLFKNINSVFKKGAEGELQIQISNMQLEWIAKELKDYTKPIVSSFALIGFAFFILMYDKDLKDVALTIFIVALVRIFYKL